MAETLPGWSAPVYAGMAEAPLFHGVPILFFGLDLLGTLLAAVCLAQFVHAVYAVVAVLAGGLLYVVVLLGRAIEPRFGRIVMEYWSYQRRYEG